MFPGRNDESFQEMDNAFRRWFARYGFEHDRFSEQRWSIHRANPNVTLDQYRCRVLHRYGQIVSSKMIIYLDLKYWINLRKVLLGEKVERGYIDLYSLLTEAVDRGTIICPLSFWIFEELLKQADFESRKATARLIDLLSDGVAFMSHGEIVGQEILHFIKKVNPHYSDSKNWPVHECIWTRTMSFLGDRIPVWPTTVFSESDQLLLQKNWEDFYFFMPLEELISNVESVSPDLLYVGYDVKEINRRKQQVRLEHRSFKSLFLAELMHTIKENEDHWFEAMAYLYFLETGIKNPVNVDALPEERKKTARALMWFAFKKNKIKNELPSYHIPAGLYAATCWDNTRQLSENDVLDFHHAQLAIPYWDVFLTETSLKSLACSGNLRFNEIYDTIIIADPIEAFEYLREKSRKDSAGCGRVVQELFKSDTYARL
jgi:hypothetical protein